MFKVMPIIVFTILISNISYAEPYGIGVDFGKFIGMSRYINQVLCKDMKTPNIERLLSVTDSHYVTKLNQEEMAKYKKFMKDGWDEAEGHANMLKAYEGDEGVISFCNMTDEGMLQNTKAIEAAMGVNSRP